MSDKSQSKPNPPMPAKQRYRIEFKHNRVALIMINCADTLDKVYEYAKKYARERGYEIVSIEETM